MYFVKKESKPIHVLVVWSFAVWIWSVEDALARLCFSSGKYQKSAGMLV